MQVTPSTYFEKIYEIGNACTKQYPTFLHKIAGNFLSSIDEKVSACVQECSFYDNCFNPHGYVALNNIFTKFIEAHSDIAQSCKFDENFFVCGDQQRYFVLKADAKAPFLEYVDKLGSEIITKTLSCQMNQVPFENGMQEAPSLKIICSARINNASYYHLIYKNYFWDECYCPSPSSSEYVCIKNEHTQTLFDSFLSQDEPVSIIWPSAKIFAGTAGAIFCGYKAIMEFARIWRASRSRIQPNADDPASAEMNQISKARAIAFSVGAVSLVAFAAITYFMELADLKGEIYPTTFNDVVSMRAKLR